MANNIYEFANGICVYRADLAKIELDRYQSEQENLHEPLEEEHFLSAINACRENGVLIDAGAAFGYYSALASKVRPDLHIHAIEPIPRQAQAIRRTFQVSNLSTDRLTVHPNAVFASDQKVPMVDRGVGSSIVLDIHLDKEQLLREATPIVAHDLRFFIDRAGGAVDVLKMDIQHSEAVTLAGARDALAEGLIRTLLISTHGAPRHASCLEVLRDHYAIEFESETVEGQPDGLIVATFNR